MRVFRQDVPRSRDEYPAPKPAPKSDAYLRAYKAATEKLDREQAVRDGNRALVLRDLEVARSRPPTVPDPVAEARARMMKRLA